MEQIKLNTPNKKGRSENISCNKVAYSNTATCINTENIKIFIQTS